MTTENIIPPSEVEKWRRLWLFAKNSIDFDGFIDFEDFLQNGYPLFELELKEIEEE